MSKMIQLRNVPDPLHRKLKARAAMAGMSLSDYLLAEIKDIADRPTLTELRNRLHTRKPARVEFDAARLVGGKRGTVIVLDASAAIEWLLQTSIGQRAVTQVWQDLDYFLYMGCESEMVTNASKTNSFNVSDIRLAC